MKRWEVTLPPDMKPCRADRALARLLPELAGRPLRDAFAGRDVKQNGRRIGPGAQAMPGDVLTVYLPETAPALDVVHEDGAYVIINKRQGMPTQGDGSVEAVWYRQTGDALLACHRLDVQTGGLLLLAKDAAAKARAVEAFADHRVHKTYHAIVEGTPRPQAATLHAHLQKDANRAMVRIHGHAAPGSLPIETRYRVQDSGDGLSLLEIGLVTGRTHQIRAHMAFIGHPVLGDDKYGNRTLNRVHGLRRQCLWATGLTLWDGRHFAVEAPFQLPIRHLNTDKEEVP